MSLSEISAALWRHRLMLMITFVACIAVVAIVTAALPRVYRATATVYVGTDIVSPDTSQGEQLTRTYTRLAENPNVAQAALDDLGLGITREELLDKMSFTPVERTSLLEIAAEDESRAEAQRIANAYATVFTSQVERAKADGRAPSSVALSEPATEPTDPVRPNPPVYLGIGGILALMLAGAVVLAADRLDRRVRIRSTDETLQGEPILGRIPTLIDPMTPSGNGSARGIEAAARILRTDALRVLRTNLDLATGEPARVIVVSSPGEGEGKTTVASQLALTVATDREKVAIVECDLRRPSLDRSGFAGEKRSAQGLADYLDDRAGLRAIVKPARSVPELDIVWAGGAIAEPGPLLRSEKLPEVLESLRHSHDWVILDTPPLAVGDDALIAASHVDGTLVVIDAEETTATALEAGLNRLRRIRARVLGLVINHAPPAELEAYRYLTAEPASERAVRAPSK